MNLTIIALSLSHLSKSPMISPANYQYKSFLSFKKLQMHNFYSSFLKDHSQIANRDIIQCKFVDFLNAPIIVDNAFLNPLVLNETYNIMTYCNFESLTIIECKFINCTHDKENGGAIEFKRDNITHNAKVTIYSSIFDQCSAVDGSGGAIFVCNKEGKTDFSSTHSNIILFNSSYCCYSKCNAYVNEINDTKKGYGSVMFIFADEIDLYYSSSVECPYIKSSYGAQYDLKSGKSIRSSYINASSSSSQFCSGMEYRNAKNGIFTFQTFINLTGGYISSFTELQNEDFDMSFCNFVSNTIHKLAHQSSIIYVHDCSIDLSDFCFVGTKINSDCKNFSLVYFEFDKIKPVTFRNSFIDNKLLKYLNEHITTVNISTYSDGDDDANKYTNEIKLLSLGNCQGEQSPPKFTFTPTFTQSETFTQSDPFTKSNNFDPSDPFTKSNSHVLDPTSHFTPSNKFTSSDYFTFSNYFTQSKDFVLIPVNAEEKSKISTGMTIGIGVAAACVVIAIIILIIFLIRRKKKNNMDKETVEVNDETGTSVVTANPLASMMNNDDPFEEAFKSNNSIAQDQMPPVSAIKPMRSNVSLNKLPSAPQLNESLTNESIHHMPSSPSVGHINQNPSLHEVGSLYDINDNIADS